MFTAEDAHRTPAADQDRPPRLAIVSNDDDGRLQPLVELLASEGVRSDIIPLRQAAHVDADVFWLRAGLAPDLSGPRDGFSELRVFEAHTGPVINRPSALQIAHHLLLTGRALEDAGVPHPQMVGVFDLTSAHDATRRLGFPLVLRPPYGRGGRGTIAVHDLDEFETALDRVVRERWFEQTGLVLQRFVPGAADVSVLVVDGDVIASTLVLAEPDPARGGIGRRFSACPTPLSPTAEAVAIAAVEAVGGDVMAAHLLFQTDGDVVVCDVDAVPDLGLFREEPALLPAIVAAVVARAEALVNQESLVW